MDVSEQYIKMCEKAEEIQPETKPLCTISEYIYIDKDGSFWHQTGIWSTDWNIIWLPRQDQLQEMLISPDRDFVTLLSDFHWHWAGYSGEGWRTHIYDDDEAKLRGDFTSMEQLWLAFVQKELYGKVWSGEEWVVNE